MAMATDPPSTLADKSCIKVIGGDMTATAATKALKQAGVTPKDIQVVELHDCFSANEVGHWCAKRDVCSPDLLALPQSLLLSLYALVCFLGHEPHIQ